MNREVVGYCANCKKLTKHRIIKCKDSAPLRVFETVFSMGFSTLLKREYYCECEKCESINIIKI